MRALAADQAWGAIPALKFRVPYPELAEGERLVSDNYSKSKGAGSKRFLKPIWSDIPHLCCN